LSIGEPTCPLPVRKGKLKLVQPADEELSEICNCPQIRKLVLRKPEPSAALDCLGDLNLESLEISDLPLSELPSEIRQLRSLEELRIRNSELRELPFWMADLQNLKILDLRGSNITSLPEGLGHLKKIDLRGVEMNREQVKALREQYPKLAIFASPPCKCQ
jgi:Leucine-rich repeat (LRR) protein